MASRTAPQPSLRILLVDDNRNGLAARKCVLEELGHKIETASSGADAIEIFRGGHFELVITDYKMPKMDGLELIAQLRQEAPQLPIILISGFVEAMGLSEESTGADAVIQKSASEITHLVRAVDRLVRNGSPKKKPPKSQTETGRAKRKSV